MDWIALITGLAKLIVVIISTWREKNERKKKIKKEAMSELAAGIAERDPSRITAAFDRARRAQ